MSSDALAVSLSVCPPMNCRSSHPRTVAQGIDVDSGKHDNQGPVGPLYGRLRECCSRSDWSLALVTCREDCCGTSQPCQSEHDGIKLLVIPESGKVQA